MQVEVNDYFKIVFKIPLALNKHNHNVLCSYNIYIEIDYATVIVQKAGIKQKFTFVRFLTICEDTNSGKL